MAALLRRSSSDSLAVALAVSALSQGTGRLFANHRASGDNFIGANAHPTDAFTMFSEEKEHTNALARNLDGVASMLKPQADEECWCKALRLARAARSCACVTNNNGPGIVKWLGVGPSRHTRPVSLPTFFTQSNSYASSSRFEDKAKIRALMEARGLKKEPGWSRIEIQGQLNTFLVDDKSHPRNKEIREELERMLEVMKDAGYVADLRCVLRDIPESEKERALQHHSERLAMALGHLSLPPRAPMRIIKNLRVCNDCHVATKYFAYIYKREIIVRDATRFHHFREGYCSCGDYW